MEAHNLLQMLIVAWKLNSNLFQSTADGYIHIHFKHLKHSQYIVFVRP